MNGALAPKKPLEERQITIAKILNWITGIGTAAALIGLFFIWRTLNATQTAADAAKSAAETAQHSLDKSIESFRIDERAWIEIEPIKPMLLDSASGFPATFTCDIYAKNAGKTAATDVEVKAVDLLSSEDFGNNQPVMNSTQDKMLLDKNTQMGSGKPVVVPANPVPKVIAPGTTAPAPFRLTCAAPQTFKSGHQSRHYLVGRIDYSDEFQVKHWLKFCYFVVNDRGEIWNCQQGNDEDRNPESSEEAHTASLREVKPMSAIAASPFFQLLTGALISFAGSVWANYLFYGKMAKSRAQREAGRAYNKLTTRFVHSSIADVNHPLHLLPVDIADRVEDLRYALADVNPKFDLAKLVRDSIEQAAQLRKQQTENFPPGSAK